MPANIDDVLAAARSQTCTQVLGGMGLLKPYGMDRLSRCDRSKLAKVRQRVAGFTSSKRVCREIVA